ncbi:hypothetical protein CVT26_008241 [Gymnopilus dilepis]|uniref:Uncharacterized protein n=1 Tax=Gymnopilus dilepis TaxID=231916 RepID=A0A409XX91_9AGAR|nr:hypothetical protein CVT26_008241 [Gymnopilus dilepis]
MAGITTTTHSNCNFCSKLDEPGRFKLYEPCHSKSLCGDLCQACSNLEKLEGLIGDHIAEAKKALGDLLEQHRRIREQMNSAHDPLVRKLPREVASYIFQLCMPVPSVEIGLEKWTKSEGTTPFVLAAVCKNWRRIALSTPHLWNFVSINFDAKGWRRNPYESYEFVKQQLDRSGCLPLSIRLNAETPDDDIYFLDIVQTLCHLSYRWRALEIRSHSCVFPLISGLAGAPSDLRSLRLLVPRRRAFDLPYEFRLPSAAPEEVVLANVILKSVDITWDRVTQVHAIGLQALECHEILRRAPRLKRCNLSVVDEILEWMGATPDYMVVHEALQELILGQIPTPSRVHLVLNKMTTPSLQHLTLGPSACLPKSPDVLRFLQRSSCLLKELVIDGLHVDAYNSSFEDVIDMLKKIPTLVRLDCSPSIRDNDLPNALAKILRITSIPITSHCEQFLPMLETLKLKVFPKDDIHWEGIASIFGSLGELHDPRRRPLRKVHVEYVPSQVFRWSPSLYIDEDALLRMRCVLHAGLDLTVGDEASNYDFIEDSAKQHT